MSRIPNSDLGIDSWICIRSWYSDLYLIRIDGTNEDTGEGNPWFTVDPMPSRGEMA
jgi:hypothetical protein